MKFSPSTGVFYPADIAYPELPEDLVETTDAVFAVWCEAEPGSTIAGQADGSLSIVPPSAPTLAQVKADQIVILNAAYQQAIAVPVGMATPEHGMIVGISPAILL